MPATEPSLLREHSLKGWSGLGLPRAPRDAVWGCVLEAGCIAEVKPHYRVPVQVIKVVQLLWPRGRVLCGFPLPANSDWFSCCRENPRRSESQQERLWGLISIICLGCRHGELWLSLDYCPTSAREVLLGLSIQRKSFLLPRVRPEPPKSRDPVPQCMVLTALLQMLPDMLVSYQVAGPWRRGGRPRLSQLCC